MSAKEGRVGSTDHYQDSISVDASAGLLGQTPPTISDRLGEMFEGLAGDVTFQTAHDFGGVESFVSPSSHIPAGFLI